MGETVSTRNLKRRWWKTNNISTTLHNWQLHPFARSKPPPSSCFSHSVLRTPFPLLIIPQQKDGAHQTHRGKSWPWHGLIVAPASGNPDRACALAVTREGGCLEIFWQKEWRGWSLSKREVLILLSAWEAVWQALSDHTTFSAPD